MLSLRALLWELLGLVGRRGQRLLRPPNWPAPGVPATLTLLWAPGAQLTHCLGQALSPPGGEAEEADSWLLSFNS